MISGKTKIFLMLAHPIAHVRTPEVINPVFADREIDAVMVPIHVRPEHFEDAWNGFRRMENLGGFVVSIPLKEMAFRLSDEREASARELGAANVVRRTETGRFVCANFDGAGFMAGTMQSGDVTSRHVLLVGAGGGGTAIAFALAHAKPTSLRIADADRSRAEKLAAMVGQLHPGLDVAAGVPDPHGRGLVINATPCGLHPETDPLPLDIARLEPGTIVADIIMNPARTPLLEAAERGGCAIRFGAGMLDSQIELMARFFGY